MAAVLDCAELSTREINASIKRLAAEGETEIHLLHPQARHNLGVAVFSPVHIVVKGTAGYFCGAMADGAHFHIQGNTGWSVGECMLSGEIIVERNSASGTGASIRGGTVVVKGHAGGRTGISQKGGLIVVGGNAGDFAARSAIAGTLVVLGRVAPGNAFSRRRSALVDGDPYRDRPYVRSHNGRVWRGPHGWRKHPGSDAHRVDLHL